MALPVIGISLEQRIIDGRKVNVPVMPAIRGVWLEDDEPPGYVIDGERWRLVETVDGTRCRMRA